MQLSIDHAKAMMAGCGEYSCVLMGEVLVAEFEIEPLLTTKKADGTTSILLNGPIAPWESFNMTRMAEAMAEADGDVELMINSPGGSAYEALGISKIVENYDKGQVTASVSGLSASAATVVMLAADRVELDPTSTVLVHNARLGAYGTGADLIKWGGEVQELDKAIAEFYAARTELSADEALKLMAEDRHILAKEASEYGFGEIVEPQAGASASATMARFADFLSLQAR